MSIIDVDAFLIIDVLYGIIESAIMDDKLKVLQYT